MSTPVTFSAPWPVSSETRVGEDLALFLIRRVVFAVVPGSGREAVFKRSGDRKFGLLFETRGANKSPL